MNSQQSTSFLFASNQACHLGAALLHCIQQYFNFAASLQELVHFFFFLR